MNFNRIASILLSVVFSLNALIFLGPSAGASEALDFVYSPQLSMWDSSRTALVDYLCETTDLSISLSDLPDFTFTKVGPVTPDELDEQCKFYNSVFGTWLRDYGFGLGIFDLFFGGHVEPQPDWDHGIQRPMDMKTGEWVVDRNGNFPYVASLGDFGASAPSTSDETVNGWWLPGELSSSVVVLSYDALSEACLALNEDGHDCRLVRTLKFGVYYWVIQDFSTDGGANRIYGNSSAMAYVADGEESAKDIQYDYIVNDNSTTDNSITVQDNQIIDIEGGTLNLINDLGVTVPLTIESLTFDTGNKTYTVNAYNTTNEGDEYYYTYYTYNISYNITNTYITYIGSNDAYEKEEYEFYYQLPDGRSSADLTADEIAGMSFEFADIVNYQRSATDISVRALYHFDGNTEDSSYFSTQGSFAWNLGASITYMEAPDPFGGALYLDNTRHNFIVSAPSSLGLSDFTLQFRYYHAGEPDTISQNHCFIVYAPDISWLMLIETGAIYDLAGNYLSDLPVGTWNEFALIRHSGTLYYYLNGLCIGSCSFSTPLKSFLGFDFTADNRAYSMIDELRVLNFALAEGGASYTPTAVPHDSNLVLVLPDSERPLADEYIEVVSSKTNLLGDRYNFIVNGGDSSHFHACGIDYSYYGRTILTGAFPDFNYRNYGGYGLSVGSNSLYLSSTGDDRYPVEAGTSNDYNNDWYLYYWGFGVPVFVDAANGLYDGRTYTFSIVHEDGTVDSLPFNLSSSLGNYGYGNVVYFSWGRLCYGNVFTNGSLGVKSVPMLCIVPNKGSTVDVAYIELVEGNTTDVHFEKKTAVYPGDSVPPNTAAIQSTIPVNGYTVGGVRPTLPARGDCWFPVQENRIQTCYIYTGSMWEEVGCRWYTGSRWIPIYAFDLTTLEDLFDIADAADAIVPIISESGFWRWWQLQWLDFREYLDGKFDELIAAITGRPVGSDTDITESDEEGYSHFSFSELLNTITSALVDIASTVLKEFIGLIADLIKMFIQAVMDFIGGFIGVLSDAAGHIAVLGDSVTPIGEFVRGVYDAIPDDIEVVLTGSFVVIVAVSVIGFLL